MPTSAFTLFQDFKEQLGKGVHNLASNTFKLMLTNTAPNVANTIKTDITEISAGNGYTAGGATLTTGYTESAGVGSFTIADVTITANADSIGPFRYGVVYNDTPTSPADPLVGFVDYGSAVTLGNAESLLFDFPATTFTVG